MMQRHTQALIGAAVAFSDQLSAVLSCARLHSGGMIVWRVKEMGYWDCHLVGRVEI
jgi:hypothetical protein